MPGSHGKKKKGGSKPKKKDVTQTTGANKNTKKLMGQVGAGYSRPKK